MQYIVINLLLICGLIIVSEAIAYTKLIHPSILRKLMHMATGTVVIFGSYITNYKAYTVVGLLMIVALIAARFFLPLKSLEHRFHESYGEIYFAAGVGIAALICPTLNGFVACIAALALADTAAYVAGNYFKSTRLYNNKTIAGTIACLLATYAIFASLGYNWEKSSIIGIFVAGAELLGSRGSDNMAIPIVGSLLLVFMGLFTN